MDLSLLLNRLLDQGLEKKELCSLLKISTTSFSNIKNNKSKQIPYQLGKRIEKLYFAYFGDGYLGIQKLYQECHE